MSQVKSVLIDAQEQRIHVKVEDKKVMSESEAISSTKTEPRSERYVFDTELVSFSKKVKTFKRTSFISGL